jgi:predicted secreted protein with PEFG-CTERM motif
MPIEITLMKVLSIGSFFALFAIVISMTASPAFAGQSEVTIVPLAGSNLPGCEQTQKGCWDPMVATVQVGGNVIFSNTDEAKHTFTSGTARDSPSGIFDSSLLQPGESYEWIATDAGEHSYFCMIHPWMEGLLVVETDVGKTPDMNNGGELMVTIDNSDVLGGTQVDLEFGELHVNYEITATQNGETVYEETRHAMEMTDSIQVDAVGSEDNPIDIEIVSLGIGAPGAEDDWTGPVGTVATVKVVPEFGTVAMMILVVSIISIIAVTTKSRVIPRF